MEAGIWEWEVDLIGERQNGRTNVPKAVKAPFQTEATEMVQGFVKSILEFLGVGDTVKAKINLYTRVKLQPKLHFALVYDSTDPAVRPAPNPNLKKFELFVTFFYFARLNLELEIA
eukprot:PhF_6_TR40834/c0_g1_i2/m.61817